MTMLSNTISTTMANQNLTISTNETCIQTEVPAHPFFIFAYSLVCLVSLALNAITVRVYFCTSQRLQSSVTVYLKNLAAADFFICLCLPLRIANYASNSFTMRHIYCNFGATAFYLNMYASILFMEYIAVNRYLKIVHPLETHPMQTPRAARNISIVTWFVLSAMAFIYAFFSFLTSWGNQRNERRFGCDALQSEKLSTVYKVIHSIFAGIFFLVLTSLILLYWATTQKLQVTQSPLQTKSSQRKLSKSKRNMQVLVAVFCVCFVPYHLVRTPYAFMGSKIDNCTVSQAIYILKELTVLLSVLNACLDPLIYFIFCKAFREHLGRRTRRTSSLRLSEFPENMRRLSNTGSSETRMSQATIRRLSVL